MDKQKITTIIEEEGSPEITSLSFPTLMSNIKVNNPILNYLSKLKAKGNKDTFEVSLFRRTGFDEYNNTQHGQSFDETDSLESFLGNPFLINLFTSADDKAKAKFICTQGNKYVFLLITGISNKTKYIPVPIGVAVFIPTKNGTVLEILGVEKSYNIEDFEDVQKSEFSSIQLGFNPNQQQSCGIGSFLLFVVQYFLKLSTFSTRIHCQVNPSVDLSPYPFYCNKLGFIECEEPPMTLDNLHCVDVKDLVYLRSPLDIQNTVLLLKEEPENIEEACRIVSEIVFEKKLVSSCKKIEYGQDVICQFFNKEKHGEFLITKDEFEEEFNFYGGIINKPEEENKELEKK